LPIFRVVIPVQWIVLALLLVTIVNRTRGALREIRGRTS